MSAIRDDAVLRGAASARRFPGLRDDIAGGATAALVTIPSSMGYGVLALHSLGDQYLSQAILAGLYSAIFIPLAVLAFGGRTSTMYAPRSVLAFLLGSIVLQTVAPSSAARLGERGPHTVLAVVFFLLVTAGLFQALFGALRLGALIKYIPSPVMAGFQNAVAILILVSQVDTLLGFRRHVPLSELGDHLASVQPLTLLVGLTTFLAIWYVPRLSRRIPAVAIGLVAGTAVYHALAFLGHGRALGPVIGAMPHALPTPTYLASVIARPLSLRSDRSCLPSSARRSAWLSSPPSTRCCARRRWKASPGGG